MKAINCVAFLAVYCTFACLTTPAATLHVWQASPSAGPPYGDWASAAHTIQEAVDAANAGDLVLVSNGVYAVGGRALTNAVYDVSGRTLTDSVTNRVAILKPIAVASVNGPAVTLIVGAANPGGSSLGSNAVRCAYVGTNAVLSGFTLTNGHTEDWLNLDCTGGGVWSAGVVSNCVLSGNVACFYGGGVYGGALYDCTLAGNTAVFDDGGGGGAAWATLYRCALSGNAANRMAARGGGATYCTLYNCTLSTNSAEGGGGAMYSTLYNCVLSGNVADGGGGVEGSTLYNCTITGNSARESAGGVGFGTLYNCTVYDNTAPERPN